MTTWNDVLRILPLVAILRGLTPDESVEVGEALVAAGFRCLEVPLNSPSPLESIARLRQALGERAIVGAGTVLSPAAVQEVASAGGQIIISPNTNPAVIAATKAAGLISFPAFFTPSEAFTAIDAGADALKLFPADTAGPATLRAMKVVLPKTTPVFPVGGVEPGNVAAWRAAGADGFGLGSALYKPGRSVAEVRLTADAFVAAWRAAA
ncbi:MAG: 2-dehydro-3-deoxy-6-phosphogalactonate aldolase [Caulobacter sp.]|nr:2-dehydro-3-deoxy-6-phosphogalactonate aldolase [Caulobacter sp.]